MGHRENISLGYTGQYLGMLKFATEGSAVELHVTPHDNILSYVQICRSNA